MHPLAEQLANQWITDFWSANHEIEWKATEQELRLDLSPNTILVGKCDALGYSSGELFFGEWKTLSAGRARRMAEVKSQWTRGPQALTYGLLLGSQTRRFTVRWAIKTPKPTTDFEWYRYDQAELDHWRTQVLDIADEIRRRRAAGVVPWRTNFQNCYKYGAQYACRFVDTCPTQPLVQVGEPRVPHLDIEATGPLRPEGLSDDVVVLDATRLNEYLECSEKYRRAYEMHGGGQGSQDQSEALIVGKDFHDLIANHINGLIKKE